MTHSELLEIFKGGGENDLCLGVGELDSPHWKPL